MKVFLYITSLSMGGAEQQCALLAMALKRLYGYDVEIIVSYPERSNPRLIDPLRQLSIPVHGCAWKRVSGLAKILRIFRNGGSGSVLFCYNTFPNFWGSILGRIAGIRKIYGGIRSEYLPWFHVVMDWCIQRVVSSGTIFNSFKARDRFISKYHFSKSKSHTISNIIPDSDVYHDYSRTDDLVKVITVGTFKPPKDYRTWLETIKASWYSNDKVRGIIVGYGWQAQYIYDWIDELKLNDVVEVVDGKTATDIPERLANADVYLSTSVIEGTSNSIMEGLRAALPVVATDVGDNRYLIQDGKSGYICPVKDVHSLSDAILKLADNVELRRRFGNCARKRMQEFHSKSKIAFEYNQIIKNG